MNRKGDKSLIVGLDIGTSKVVALVGEYTPGEPIEVIGIGSHESRGLKRGVVVDIESTVQSIQRAIEEAELMAGCEIRSVYASISGNHAVPELARHRADQGRRGHLRRHGARAGGGQGGRDSGRPAHPACDPAGVHRRQLAGRHPPSGRHDGRAPGSACAPRRRRAVGRAEHRQVRAAAAACRSTT
jgi:hypothetical protein